MRPKLAENEAEELRKSLETELYSRCEKRPTFYGSEAKCTSEGIRPRP